MPDAPALCTVNEIKLIAPLAVGKVGTPPPGNRKYVLKPTVVIPVCGERGDCARDDVGHVIRRVSRARGEQEQEVIVRPILMNSALGVLCHISMNSAEAFDWLQEQIEPLLTITEVLEGSAVFHKQRAG